MFFVRILGSLLVAAALTSTNLYAEKQRQTLKPLILSSLEGKPWVEKCMNRHPEIVWLADSKVRKTQEGNATLKGTYSEQLFGQKYIEFDRTIMTLHCLKLILEGSDKAYETFTAAQPKETKLSPLSFQMLHKQGQRLLHSKWQGLSSRQMAHAMETALVLGDIGKSHKARELFKPYGVRSPDHDDFYGEAIPIIAKHPHLCPSFAALPSSSKKLLIEIANLAHYGHITHLEGDVGMLSKLKHSGIAFKDPTALAFDLFVHTCDVAGALAHINNVSSVVYTELTHQAMQAMAESLTVLANPDKTQWDAYNTYLEVRSSWLGLNAQESSERVLTRIGAMLRLFTLEEGIVLRKAISALDASMRERIALQLNVSEDAVSGRTPTYMPAVLVNLFNNALLGETKEERLFKAITIGLPFITKVLERHKEVLKKDEMDLNIPLNFNEAAGIAKSSPHLLSKEFTIDEEGVIHLVWD